MWRLMIVIAATTIAVWSCANIGTVEGGPIDVDPPEVLNTVPENESVFFEPSSFSIFFDEFLGPGNISNDITVSPPLKYKVKGSIRGKIIVVEWEDTLKENTSYVFQFGDGIKDLNEGNILKNFIYVFSTGDHIDSLSITGKVKTAEDKSPMKDAIVGLYSWNGETNDSTPVNEKPYYYSMSEESGAFHLRYLKEGTYRLVAFEDENGNFKYDPDLEKGGFLPFPVDPSKDIFDMLEVRAFTPIPKLRLLEERVIHKRAIRMVFNRPVDTLFVSPLIPQEIDPNIQFNNTRDTAIMWFQSTLPDSISYLYHTNTSSDTVTLKKRSLKEYKYKHQKMFDRELAPDKKAQFKANIPITAIDTTGMLVQNDSLVIAIDSIELLDNGSFIAYFKRKGAGSYIYKLPPKSLTYWDDNQNSDTVKFNFEVLEKDEYGQLELNIHPGRRDSLLIEVWSGEDPILKTTITDTAQFILPFVKPGAYRMEATVDWNGNGRWDPGDYLKNRLPEPIIENNEEVQIKANWEIEYTWEIPEDEIKRPENYYIIEETNAESDTIRE